jgi:hypothetical protein
MHSSIEARGSLTPTVQKKQAKNGYNILRASPEIFFAVEVEKESLDHYHTEKQGQRSRGKREQQEKGKMVIN